MIKTIQIETTFFCGQKENLFANQSKNQIVFFDPSKKYLICSTLIFTIWGVLTLLG